MNKYLIERIRWVSKDETGGILHGFDEVYREEVTADFYTVDDKGTLTFIRNGAEKPVAIFGIMNGVAVKSYAHGEWRSVTLAE